MSRAEERKRATELKSLDARALIKTALPVVLPQLTSAQVDQLQRVLDAAVINADVQKKWEELDRQAIKGKIVHSNEYLRDPDAVVRRDKVSSQKIVVRPGENVVRLDFQKLLTRDALKPMSDNPDEAGYLLVVAAAYEHLGVWLVLDTDSSAMAQNLHSEANDPQKWRVRLLLGYKPGALIEQIKTDTGSLTRNALLSVTRLGAGYWEWVHQGPTLKALRNAIDDVSFQISIGRNEHWWWSIHRTEFYVVSKISDTLGGADWPKESIWDQPHQIQVQALHLINNGKLMEAAKFAQLAAYQAEWCARAVHAYIDATTRGASRAVKILEVAETCGKIAEWILSLLAVGEGVFRLLSRKGAASAAEAGAQRQLTGGAAAASGPGTCPTAGTATAAHGGNERANRRNGRREDKLGRCHQPCTPTDRPASHPSRDARGTSLFVGKRTIQEDAQGVHGMAFSKSQCVPCRKEHSIGTHQHGPLGEMVSYQLMLRCFVVKLFLLGDFASPFSNFSAFAIVRFQNGNLTTNWRLHSVQE